MPPDVASASRPELWGWRTDIVMPGMNGVELARHAKRLRPQIKVMFMTGYAARAAEATHLGRLLYKPLRVAEIDAELCNLLAVA